MAFPRFGFFCKASYLCRGTCKTGRKMGLFFGKKKFIGCFLFREEKGPLNWGGLWKKTPGFFFSFVFPLK